MDFLILMIAYGVTFGSFSYILLLGDSNFHRNGVIGKIRQGLLQTVKWVHRNLLPRAVQRLVNRFINYLIHERSVSLLAKLEKIGFKNNPSTSKRDRLGICLFVSFSASLYFIYVWIFQQHLFMERPMPVFIMMSLALLSLLVAAFMFYHVYLALTNQTTNERYKRSQAVQEIRQHCNCSSSRNAKTVSQHKNSHSKRNHSRQADVIPLCKNIYDKGFVWNLYEILFPVSNR
eukprot:XP_011671588.1 PREDICTED: uncharacterized protein LOC105441797 [Strongylocentrotus purpuratus]